MSQLDKGKERDGRMVLNSVPGVGPVILNRLIERFTRDPWQILSANQAELRQVKGVGNQVVESMQKLLNSGWLKKEKEKMEKMSARFVHTDELPKFLNQLTDPPIGLYCLGEIPKQPCISIVGTRGPSIYGKKLARQFASELAQAGFCIVSGMARGVDSEAHMGALEVGGKTMAFLGSGLDVIYPPENLELYRKIQSSGAILSEFQLGRRADRRTFPMRNRLVAGISLGVLVIESAKSGGSMITASFAADQGRTVFALPGRVDQPESQGCLDLLRDGATLVRNPNDIIEELSPMLNHSEVQSNTKVTPEKKDLSYLDQEEQILMHSLSAGEVLDSDGLQKTTKIELSKIVPALTMLEIRGLIIKRPDGKYEANP